MERLKIVTFNIRCPLEIDEKNYFPNRKHLVDRFIDQIGADIICFQEVRPTVKEQFILEHPKYQFYGDFRFVPQSDDDETPLVALKQGKYALLSYARRWLSPTPTVPESKYVPDTYWPRVYVELKLQNRETGKEFWLINTHFEQDKYSIEHSFKQILNRVKELKRDGLDVFVTGDMNWDYGFLGQFNDGTLVDLTGNLDYSYTEYGNHLWKIDYIYSTRSDLKCVTTRADVIEDGIYISDHFPVICEIDNF